MTSESIQLSIQKAGELLKTARHAVAFTGAGISTPSGIPDFRSARTGLWARFDPMEVASISSFRTTPERFYNWLRPLLQDIWRAQPNPAHLALARLENAGILKAVITQNIDALHQQAGSKNVLEVHGSLRTMTCSSCVQTHLSNDFQMQMENAGDMPHCPQCRRILKPDITLFGEMLPAETWMQAEEHCRRADVVLVAGSSLEVWPAAALPEIGVENGARLIINNLSSTHLDSNADITIPFDVAEILPQIADLVLGG